MGAWDHAPDGLRPRGAPYRLEAPVPAAGADWAFSPPPGAAFRIIGGSAQLVTSATVANRQVSILVDDRNVTLFTIEASGTQAVSLTQVYDILPGCTLTTLTSTHLPIFLPVGVILDYRFRLRSSTGSLQAGDQWSAIYFLVEELGASDQ